MMTGLGGPLPAWAQEVPDSTVVVLEPIEVTATPFNIAAEAAPFAVSTRSRSTAELNTEPAIDLENLAYTIPGLWVNSRTHYATDERVTMRGLGWRSQFGVRGIQAIMDGIPLTMADGQAILNIVDPAFVREVEVIRGPASTFWGNASGGVLYLSTQPSANAPRARVRQIVGSYGLTKTDVQVTPALGPHQLSAYGSYLAQDGFREHSSARLGRAGLTGHYVLGEERGLRLFGAYANMPRADNPSSLDDSTAAADPRQARDFIVQQKVGKESQQGQLGLSYYDETGAGLLRATAYGIFRELENPIPTDYIDLSRRAGGVRLTLQNDRTPLAWGMGVEGRLQRDDRREYTNEGGTPGAQTISQLETVYNGAAFARAALPLTDRLRLSAGLRYDWLRFAADVRRGVSSTGDRLFQALSPSLGLSYRLDRAHLFANFSTALEAPTTSELGNRPDGRGGFNADVEPERTYGVEVGAQGLLRGARLSYDVALFAMQVRNLLEPYQLAADGPVFYRNAGRTRHLGVEAALQWYLPYRLSLTASYTLVRATFASASANDVRLDGNRVPGVPEQVVGGTVQWQPGPIWLTLDMRGVSAFYVNSENTAENEGYLVLDARLSHPGLALAPRLTLQPFVAVNNALDVRYNDTIVNAFGGRYYEPAAGRHWQAGLTLQLD